MTWNNDTVRELERNSLRAFVASCSEWFTGRVLDYGCGKQPYRPIVEAAGGIYHGYDVAAFPGNVSGEDIGVTEEEVRIDLECLYDAVLCNQVLQYTYDPEGELCDMRNALRSGGALVLTYATTWPEVEKEDLWRFTYHGMEELFRRRRFEIVKHERRAELNLNGYVLPIGGGIVGVRP